MQRKSAKNYLASNKNGEILGSFGQTWIEEYRNTANDADQRNQVRAAAYKIDPAHRSIPTSHSAVREVLDRYTGRFSHKKPEMDGKPEAHLEEGEVPSIAGKFSERWRLYMYDQNCYKHLEQYLQLCKTTLEKKLLEPDFEVPLGEIRAFCQAENNGDDRIVNQVFRWLRRTAEEDEC